MEDMIARIVEMDKKARDMTAQAQKNKLDYEQQIIEKRESIKQDYLDRAQKRIAINSEAAQKRSEKSLQLIEERDNKTIDALNSSYEKNCDKWVDEIVSRVVE